MRIAISVPKEQEDPDVETATNGILRRMREMTRSDTPPLLTIVTSLTSATERALARAAMKQPNSTLEVPVFGSRDEYPTIFPAGAERQEVADLLAEADHVVSLPRGGEGQGDLLRLGRYLADHCDVLIVGKGDEILASRSQIAGHAAARARERRVPLIYLEKGATIEEGRMGGLSRPLVHAIDTYNRAPIRPALLAEAIERRMEIFVGQSESAGLDPDYARPVFDWIVPHFVRADTLATRFQRSYFRLGMAVLLIAAAAVLLAASQILFDFEYPRMALIEVGLMLVLLFLLIYGKRRRVHERWMAMRALAERLRTIAFLAVAGVDIGDFISSASNRGRSQSWSSRVIEELWTSAPSNDATRVSIDGLRRFLSTVWFQDQLDYHRRTALTSRRRDRVLARAVATLFVATLVSALLHGLEVVHDASDWLILASISLPAVAGALDGIRAQREYIRSAERSSRLSLKMRDLLIQMREATSLANLQEIARGAGNIMLEENQDWHSTMRFHDLELRV